MSMHGLGTYILSALIQVFTVNSDPLREWEDIKIR